MNKKILIIGNSAAAYALAYNLSKSNNIFILPGNDTTTEFATNVDIREDSTYEILDFVMENDIELTIPISLKALNTNICEIFTRNNLEIFAPSSNISNVLFNKANLKKLLYKLKIPTPKFGIFEKQNIAQDYIKNFNSPFVFKTNEPSSATLVTTPALGKKLLNTYFTKQGQKIIIENYINGTNFTIYFITDGFKAIQIGSSLVYKHALNGNGGQLTSGMGACTPNYKITLNQEKYITNNIVYPLLNYFEKNFEPYLGIIGIQGIITPENEIQVISVEPFMQSTDCAAILEILDANLINLIKSCIIGSFSDEAINIPTKNIAGTSVTIFNSNKENSNNIITGLNNIDEDILLSFNPKVRKNKYLEFEAEQGEVVIITGFGRTASTATKKVYENIQDLSFKGLRYRTDICALPNDIF